MFQKEDGRNVGEGVLFSPVPLPTPLDKAELIRAGLGMGSLLLFEHSDAWEFHDEILRKFPNLADGGGYELFRTCGNSSALHVIPSPSGGYTTSYVKSVRQSCMCAPFKKICHWKKLVKWYADVYYFL